MILKFKNFISRFFPKSVLISVKFVIRWYSNRAFEVALLLVSIRHRIALKRIRKKVRQRIKLKVAFFAIHESVWKYDEVYKLFNNDTRYEPIIVICPYIVYGEETMLCEMEKAYKYFKKKRYNTIKSLNNAGKWIDIRKEINPDIVFFTNPHNLTRDEYYITSWKGVLTCYVQYSYHITHLNSIQYDQLFHNLIWKLFYETNIHFELAQKHSRNKAKNVIITGYPGTDVFLDSNYKPKNVWKNSNNEVKRIVWAPHHTIKPNDANLGYSTFLKYYRVFVELLTLFSGRIQIAFKPHPVLKSKLYEYKPWGKATTDEYYNFWRDNENSQLEEGDYADLFLSSDALIFDSASFMTEYIYTEKPSLFLISDNKITERFNIFGELVFKKHYHGNNFDDIVSFINLVVLLGDDMKKKERISFKNSFLIPPNNVSASMNIFNFISNQLT